MTDYSDVPTIFTGDWIDAAWINQYIGDNFRAVMQGMAATGDIPYALDANTVGALGKPASEGLLNMGADGVPEWLLTALIGNSLQFNGSAFEFAPLVYRRQGGDATNWQNGGTNNYTPTERIKIQLGVLSISVNPTGTGSVTYGVPFAARPALFFGIGAGGGAITYRFEGDDANGFDLALRDVITSGLLTVDVNWLAIGKI